jgi:hypothetical protein
MLPRMLIKQAGLNAQFSIAMPLLNLMSRPSPAVFRIYGTDMVGKEHIQN